MHSARSIVGLLALSCLFAGCDGGGGDNTTAPANESKAASEAALQKFRPGPSGKVGTPTSPATTK
jgi:hypothetical protein